MKFSDEAWYLYQQYFFVADDQRALLEQGMDNQLDFFLAQAGGDEELATGMLTLHTATVLAHDAGGSVEEHLRHIAEHAGSDAAREYMWKTVNKARRYEQEHAR